MSDIKEIASPSVEAFLAESNNRVLQAQAEHQRLTALAASLPAGTPVPNAMMLFGYCSSHTVDFVFNALPGVGYEKISNLMKLYPPVPVVDCFGDTQSQKPKSHLREMEQSYAVLDLYPVVVKQEPAGKDNRGRDVVKNVARWWSELATGLCCIQVAGLPDDTLGLQPEKYIPSTQHFSTGSLRYFKLKIASLPLEPTPLEKWGKAWKETFDAYRMRADAEQLLNMVKATVLVHVNSRPAESFDWEQMLERFSELNTKFSAEQLQVLKEFVLVQIEAYPAALLAQQADLAKGVAWFQSFLSNWSSVRQTEDTLSRVLYRAQKETGLKLNIKWLKNEESNRFNVRLSLPGPFPGVTHEAVWTDFEVQTSSDKPALKPQDIQVEYA